MSARKQKGSHEMRIIWGYLYSSRKVLGSFGIPPKEQLRISHAEEDRKILRLILQSFLKALICSKRLALQTKHVTQIAVDSAGVVVSPCESNLEAVCRLAETPLPC